ncbi:hypothetical protein PG991_009199 [Apiospora marii]|uniref:Uncharacterized protein n=1 Tax=Apiospora marii TaxID=335849 RepID=A0ABR1RK15_9PEZI
MRLLIYSDLPPALRRAWTKGLYPSILRVNKQICLEASPLLYSENQFRFVDLWLWPYNGIARVDVTPFFSGISLQASSLRHICVNFPSFKQSYFEPSDMVKMDDVDINNLRTIQATCTGLTTIEFLLCFAADVPHMNNQDNIVDPLTALESLLKSIPSLKQVIVNAHSSKNTNMTDENDVECGSNDIWRRMIGYGWIVNVSDPPKRTWISSDALVGFHNEYGRKLARRGSRGLEQHQKAKWEQE